MASFRALTSYTPFEAAQSHYRSKNLVSTSWMYNFTNFRQNLETNGFQIQFSCFCDHFNPEIIYTPKALDTQSK